MRLEVGRVAVAGVLVGTLAGTGGVASAASQVAPAHIKAVTFTGSTSSPTITITGTGFGAKPAPNLPVSPAKANLTYNSLCSTQPLAGNGRAGRDYKASNLGISWAKTPPKGYAAGVYVPGKYLDCIGLLITNWSPTKVVLHLGCQYALYPKIAPGDKFLVTVHGTSKRLTVAYKH